MNRFFVFLEPVSNPIVDGIRNRFLAPQFNLQAYLNMQEDMVIRPYSRNTIVWENNATQWFTRAWMQEITMEEACQGIAGEMNQTLAEEQ